MNGMGRIFTRGDIYWIAYSHRGTEHRESTHATGTKGETLARKLLKKRLGEIGRGRLIGPQEEKVAFEELAADLERDYMINGKRSAETLGYQLRHLRASFAMLRAVDVTTDRIRTHVAGRQAAGAANATINRELAALGRMFTLAIQAGRLSTRPHIPMLEENNARQGFLDHASFLALQDALPDHLKDPVAFLYFAGWRVSEMRGLEWRDVDLAGRVVRLRPELSKNKDGRVLPLSGELLDLVERAVMARRLDCVHVFHIDGQPIGDFRKPWKTACVTAGLGAIVPTGKLTPRGEPKLGYEGLIPHDLRRSAVRNMVRAGIPERVCMALSGHKTRAIFDRYNIVSEADLTAAADRLHQHLHAQPKTARVVRLVRESRTNLGQFPDGAEVAVR
jgi:integrase